MLDVVVSTGPPPTDRGEVLGAVEFGHRPQAPSLDAGHPTVGVASREESQPAVRETWTTTAAVTTGRRDGIVYGHDGTHLFGALQVPRTDRYRAPTRAAYRRLLALLADLGYPHLVRMWNHVADINRPNAEGLEIYRDFCQGRAEGFEDAGPAAADHLPAATGIGARAGGVTVYFVASRTATPVHFENPRQVPAHRYPRRYGPRSPSFARATLLPAAGTLFLSGTASIVGHETVHVGDLEGQCHTTLENIRILLEDVSERSGGAVDLDSFRLVKAYVRNAGDVPYVRHRLREVAGPLVPVELFTVDICRGELLVEVEGVLDVKFPGPRDRW
jgi:chorismate lyase/3-hydroxybenzoate synthase